MADLRLALGIVLLVLLSIGGLFGVVIGAQHAEPCVERQAEQARCNHRNHRMELEQGVYLCRCNKGSR